MTEIPLKKLNDLMPLLAEEFGIDLEMGDFKENASEFNAKICSLWAIGAILEMSNLGIIKQRDYSRFIDSFADLPGYKLWDQVDELRFFLVDPSCLGLTIGAIMKMLVDEKDRDPMGNAIAMWYTESGRTALQKTSFEHIYKK